jgi:hypothetical protein
VPDLWLTAGAVVIFGAEEAPFCHNPHGYLVIRGEGAKHMKVRMQYQQVIPDAFKLMLNIEE